jgi:hypothetical protein
MLEPSIASHYISDNLEITVFTLIFKGETP